jgi:hypothetical protein
MGSVYGVTMKERPILFSGPMVRAILDGQKTQTRRVIKSPAKNMQKDGCQVIRRNPDNDPWYKDYIWSMRTSTGVWGDYTNEKFLKFCPYGVPGDRLWVRETWKGWVPDTMWIVKYRSDDHIKNTCCDWDEGPQYNSPFDLGLDCEPTRWRPSIFMPRWASRITLEVKGVRAERLQDITEADSQDEGVIPSIVGQKYRSGFQTLWDSINKKRGYGWDTNPWVWAVEFMMI